MDFGLTRYVVRMFTDLERDEEIREFEKQIGPTIEEDTLFLSSAKEPPSPYDPLAEVNLPHLPVGMATASPPGGRGGHEERIA